MTQLTNYKATKIRCRQWQDDYVIYDQLSGDTHVLDVVSGELICALSKQTMSRAKLLALLNDLCFDATESEIEGYLFDFIEKFELLGLLISE